MDIQTNATDDGRIIALQVGFASLVALLGKENPDLKNTLVNFLERTGMDPVNTRSSAAFHELIEMIRALEETRG